MVSGYKISVALFKYASKIKRCVFSLGDESTCDIMSVRTVNIKMFDEMVYTLGSVSYVLKMQINLIYIPKPFGFHGL